MVYISSVYFGSHGFGLYDSIARASSFCFKGIELRQEHFGESDVMESLKRASRDFPEIEFTIHAPLCSEQGITVINPCMGLNNKNRKTLQRLFDGVEAVNAKNVVFHAGFREVVLFNRVAWLPRLHWPKLLIPHPIAERNFVEFMREAVKLSEGISTSVLLENPPNSGLSLFLKRKQDFEKAFQQIPGIGIALDMGHAFATNSLNEFLGLSDKIKEVHVSYTPCEKDLHLTVSMQHLEPLKAIPQLKKIPLVLEHDKSSFIESVLREKKLVERFLKTL